MCSVYRVLAGDRKQNGPLSSGLDVYYFPWCWMRLGCIFSSAVALRPVFKANVVLFANHLEILLHKIVSESSQERLEEADSVDLSKWISAAWYRHRWAICEQQETNSDMRNSSWTSESKRFSQSKTQITSNEWTTLPLETVSAWIKWCCTCVYSNPGRTTSLKGCMGEVRVDAWWYKLLDYLWFASHRLQSAHSFHV